MKFIPLAPSVFIAFILTVLTLPAALAAEKTLVSGRVAYGEMGIEEAEVAALADGKVVDKVKSGYHGAFLLHLPEGAYALKARGEVARGRFASGVLLGVEIPRGLKRLDRLTIPIAEE